ncbi:hypothetical protein D9M68_317430 [compost metagenome]
MDVPSAIGLNEAVHCINASRAGSKHQIDRILPVICLTVDQRALVGLWPKKNLLR